MHWNWHGSGLVNVCTKSVHRFEVSCGESNHGLRLRSCLVPFVSDSWIRLNCLSISTLTPDSDNNYKIFFNFDSHFRLGPHRFFDFDSRLRLYPQELLDSNFRLRLQPGKPFDVDSWLQRAIWLRLLTSTSFFRFFDSRFRLRRLTFLKSNYGSLIFPISFEFDS